MLLDVVVVVVLATVPFLVAVEEMALVLDAEEMAVVAVVMVELFSLWDCWNFVVPSIHW